MKTISVGNIKQLKEAIAVNLSSPAGLSARIVGCDADLSHANLSEADLNGADLNGANLSDADLSHADLSEADLSDADLSDANLSSANLSDADLSEADLSHADLNGAYLNGANLSDANLSDANLSCADLSHADLSHADLNGADLNGANLSGAIGLAKVSIEHIRKIVELAGIVVFDEKSLSMESVHGECRTAHCGAGWICVLDETAKKLEKEIGWNAAACLSCPVPEFTSLFYSSDREMLDFLRSVQVDRGAKLKTKYSLA